MVTACCPLCKRPITTIRGGVRLSKMKAEMFDVILTRPGISLRELTRKFYGVETRNKQHVVRTHINQMNDLFAETDINIRGKSYYGYSVRGLKK